MNKEQFKKWRKKNGFSQAEAAETLGLKRRMIQIPKYIRLACEAVELKKKLKKLI